MRKCFLVFLTLILLFPVTAFASEATHTFEDNILYAQGEDYTNKIQIDSFENLSAYDKQKVENLVSGRNYAIVFDGTDIYVFVSGYEIKLDFPSLYIGDSVSGFGEFYGDFYSDNGKVEFFSICATGLDFEAEYYYDPGNYLRDANYDTEKRFDDFWVVSNNKGQVKNNIIICNQKDSRINSDSPEIGLKIDIVIGFLTFFTVIILCNYIYKFFKIFF